MGQGDPLDAPGISYRANVLHRAAQAVLFATTALVAVAIAQPGVAENIRGDATGPTTAPGFSHPSAAWYAPHTSGMDRVWRSSRRAHRMGLRAHRMGSPFDSAKTNDHHR